MNILMDSSIKLIIIMNSDVKIDFSQYQQYIDKLIFMMIIIYSDIIFIIHNSSYIIQISVKDILQ